MSKYLIITLLLMSRLAVTAQSVADSTETNRFSLIKAGNGVTNIVAGTQIDSLTGGVILRRDSVYLFADYVVMKNDKHVTAVGNVSIYESDSLKVFCDTLFFSGNDEQAILKKNVVLEKNDELLKTDHMIYRLDTKDAIFNQGATLRTGETLIRSTEGYYSSKNNTAKFFNHVQVIDTAFNVQTDTLYYNRLTEKATFKGPTLILQDSAKIYTQQGHYNLGKKTGLFEGDPQYIGQDGTEALAKRIIYDGAHKEMILEGDAIIKKENQVGNAVKIAISESTGDMVLTGNARFRKDKQEVEAPVITYNNKTEIFETRGGALIKNENATIISDQTGTDPSTGRQRAIGHVVWEDTVSNMQMYADTLIMADDDGFDALGALDSHPLLIQHSLGDTLYMTSRQFRFWEEVQADSLQSDTLGFFSGQSAVKILSNSFQAVSDSLIFNDKDSVFTLISNAMLWSDSLQLSGDTILITFKNGQVDHLKVPTNPFVVIDTDTLLQDQMKGNVLNGVFNDGKMDSLNIEGNAESIYFLKDDDNAFMGMKKSQCGQINLLFDVIGDMYEIHFVTKPTNKIMPMSKLDLAKTRLDGYIWVPDKKPKLEFFLQLMSLKNDF